MVSGLASRNYQGIKEQIFSSEDKSGWVSAKVKGEQEKEFEYIGKDKKFNLAHADSEKMYRHLIETVRSGIYIVDARGNLFYVNHAFVEILGYNTKQEVLGLNLDKELYANRNTEDFLNKMEKTGFVRDYEFKYTRKDGSIAILSATSNYVRNDRGEVIGIEGIVLDITEKSKLQDALLAEKRKLELILGFDEKINFIREFDVLVDFIVDQTTDILESQKCSLMLKDKTTKELYMQGAKGLNDELIKVTRVKLGEPIAGIVAKEGDPLLVKNIEYEKRFQRAKRPSYLGRSFMIVPIKLEDKLMGVINVADKCSSLSYEEPFNEIDLRVLCTIARKVAVAIENVKVYQELNILSVTDPITQIYNHRRFSESLDHEIKRVKRGKGNLSIVMMDVDDFKSYNDTFGHLEGDELLKRLGRILKNQLRGTDIVCRYAGDEFAIVFPDTDADGAKKGAQKIKKAVGRYPFKRKVTLSTGIAIYEPEMTKKDLIFKADKALYQAKHQGKDRICIYE